MSSIAFGTSKSMMEIEFGKLVRENYRWARNVAFRRLHNMADSEDVVQESFIRAWCGFQRYDRSASVKSWLYRIITNQIIDRSRRKRQAPTCSLDTGLGSDVDGLACIIQDPSAGPEAQAISAVEKAEIGRALADMPEKFSRVMRKYAFDECSYQEIADSFGCSLGTVRSRLHRARAVVKRSLNPSLSAAESMSTMHRVIDRAA